MGSGFGYLKIIEFGSGFKYFKGFWDTVPVWTNNIIVIITKYFCGENVKNNS